LLLFSYVQAYVAGEIGAIQIDIAERQILVRQGREDFQVIPLYKPSAYARE
jgi:hypothetical protein